MSKMNSAPTEVSKTLYTLYVLYYGWGGCAGAEIQIERGTSEGKAMRYAELWLTLRLTDRIFDRMAALCTEA